MTSGQTSPQTPPLPTPVRAAPAAVADIPIDQIFTRLLIRDRVEQDDQELEELTRSIQALGLSNPIRITPTPSGSGYELIQGFRRLSVYRRLAARTGEGQWRTIPALIQKPTSDLTGLYRRMVDENVIRKDLSFAEMATTALTFAADPATEAQTLQQAIALLFASASYSKRSYIKSFARLIEQLGHTLLYPNEIPRALGVAVSRRLAEQPDLIAAIGADLRDWEERSVADELRVLQRTLETHDAPAPERKQSCIANRSADVSLTVKTQHGLARCVATRGKIELRMDRDFAALSRDSLNAAVAQLLAALAAA